MKLEARVVAILGEESELAAQAAECADEQGRFWEFKGVLYANQSGENQGAFSRENLGRFAEALALDTAAFGSCLDSGRYAQMVKEDTQTARELGLIGTPTILVNERQVGISLEEVRAAVQEALAAGS